MQGIPYSILPIWAVVSIIPIILLPSVGSSWFNVVVFELPPLVFTITLTSTILPAMVVVPRVVTFTNWLADASSEFIGYGNETDELGDSDADGLALALGL